MKNQPLRVRAAKIIAFVLVVGLLVTLVSGELTPLLLSVIIALALWQGTLMLESVGRRRD